MYSKKSLFLFKDEFFYAVVNPILNLIKCATRNFRRKNSVSLKTCLGVSWFEEFYTLNKKLS